MHVTLKITIFTDQGVYIQKAILGLFNGGSREEDSELLPAGMDYLNLKWRNEAFR